MNLNFIINLLLVFICCTNISFAGNEPIRQNIYNFKQIATLSKGLERELAAEHAQVALIARVGLSPKILPPGVNYSHAGFAVYSRIKTQDGRLVPGYAVYNLYQGKDRNGISYLAQDYPVDYLSVSQILKVGVLIPNKKLQHALLKTIFSNAYNSLHNENYSVLSNPFNNDFQNCTEFVLDVIFSSIYKTVNKQKIKTIIAAYYKPQPILVDQFRLKMSANVMPDVSISDHDGPIATTTFTSILRFLSEYNIVDEAFNFSINPDTLYATREKIKI